MKKSLFLFFPFAVFFVQGVSTQQLGDLYTEKNAGFSMSMPAGWQIFDFNQKYLMITGPEDSGFTPNIGFGDEDYDGTLPEYIDAFLELIPVFFTNLVVLEKSSVKTNSGILGESVTYLCTMGTVNVWQKIFVFPGRTQGVLAVTCTAPGTNGARYEAVFDASIRTFTWIR